MALLTCPKCATQMDESNFYSHRDGATKTELCKKCLTMHIDNYDPETFVWILKDLDFPYVPSKWNKLRDAAFEKNPKKMTGMSVLGKYLASMKLKPWNKYSWADTEKLRQEDEAKAAKIEELRSVAEVAIKEQYEKGEISEAQYKTLMSARSQQQNDYNSYANMPIVFPEDNFLAKDDIPDPAEELTKEDKIVLAMKWGREYQPAQWIKMEQKYSEMMNSFDIHDSDSTSALILICKTYLKMNEAIDCNDMETYQKLARVYESLRKSAKFTAAQNKDEKASIFDAAGQIVAFAEKAGGFIPRYPTDIPQDKIDACLQDNEKYLKQLVTEDLGFGQQIEIAVKKIEAQRLANEESDKDVTDEDIAEHYENIELEREEDDRLLSPVDDEEDENGT